MALVERLPRPRVSQAGVPVAALMPSVYLAALGEHVDFELKADTLLYFKGGVVESWKNSPWRSPTCPKMEHVS